MTLRELSYEYKAHADTLSLRMKQLRLAARETEDPERRHRPGAADSGAASPAAGGQGARRTDTKLLRQEVSQE